MTKASKLQYPLHGTGAGRYVDLSAGLAIIGQAKQFEIMLGQPGAYSRPMFIALLDGKMRSYLPMALNTKLGRSEQFVATRLTGKTVLLKDISKVSRAEASRKAARV